MKKRDRGTKEVFQPVGPKDGVRVYITDRGNIVDEELMKGYKVSTPASQQIESSWKPPILQPPHNLNSLMSWIDLNVTHSSCVRVKGKDAVGIGYHFESDDEEKNKGKENDEEYNRLKAFFEKVNSKEDLTKVLAKVVLDYEGCGNSYLEVSRDINGDVNGLYHINAITMRWLKDKQRLVQRVGERYVYFKEFGDERILNNKTGNFVKQCDPEFVANEVIPLIQYTYKSSVYGLPEWLPALYPLYGDMKETEYNIDFFENYGVPAYAILIEGGTLNPDVLEEITRFFETTLKGSNHKTLVLSTPKGAELKFERLSVEQKEASFRVYRKDNRDSILTAHHVPPYRVGIVETGALGGNVAEATDKIYLDSVIDPRQKEFSWVINELIIVQGFGIQGWRIKFDDINIENIKRDAEIHNSYFNMGVLTPNQIRQEKGLDPYVGGDVYYIAGNNVPVGVDEEGAKQGAREIPNIDGISEEEDETGGKKPKKEEDEE